MIYFLDIITTLCFHKILQMNIIVQQKKKSSKSKMIFQILLVYLIYVPHYFSTTIIASTTQIQIELFSEVTLLPHTNASSLNYPTDTIRQVVTSKNHLFILSTDSVVQIYNKNNPSILEGAIDDYFVSIVQSSLAVSFMTMDQNFDTLALTGFSNFILTHIIYSTINQSLPVFSTIINVPTQYTQPPWTTFMANGIVYSFFSASKVNDSIHSLCLLNNSTLIYTLPTVNASLAISPDHRLALVWTKYSQVFFFDIANNFTLVSIYNGSVIKKSDKTQSIKFSSDSAFAILETDHHNPIRVINLSDFTVAYSFAVDKKIVSVDFLDTSNRFLLVNCDKLTYIYDTVTNSTITFNASLAADSVFVDQDSSQLIADIGGTFSAYGINGTIDGNLSFSHYINSSSDASPSPAVNNASNNSNVPNTPTTPNNTTNSNSSAIPSVINSSSTLPYESPFSYSLNLSVWQNQTFEAMRSVSSVTEGVLIKFNTVVFSSPLTCFFLGFFNYFVLNSLYVLLPIPLPDLVFSELDSVFNSTNINLLNSLGINLTVPTFTDQLIDEDRPLYFGVSSDLIFTNAYPLFIILFNTIIVEAVIAVRSSSSKDSFLHLLSFKREKVYFGLIVSILVQNVLPWKYVTFNRFLNFKTKINCLTYHTVFVLMGYFIIVTFLSLFSQKQKRKIRKSNMHEWMIGFQNFLYPLFILCDEPLYFLVLILCSKITEIIIFAKYSKEVIVIKFLQMGSFGCELLYHLTFFVFSFTTDQRFVIYTSIFCLFFFLFGALINFLMVAVTLVSFAKHLCKKSRNKNRVIQNLPKAHKNEVQMSPNQTIRYKLPTKHKDNHDSVQFKQISLNKIMKPSNSRINNKRYIWKVRQQRNKIIEARPEKKVAHLFTPKRKLQD